MKIVSSLYFFLYLFIFINFYSLSLNASVLIIDNTSQNNNTDNSTVNFSYGCKNFVNGICQECSNGFYFDAFGICQKIDLYCLQFNQQAGICENCYPGYTVIDGKCSLSQNNVSDTGCKRFSNNKCV